MNRLISKKSLANDLMRLEISTPVAYKTIQPGQYIIARTEPGQAGMMLPVIKNDEHKGTVTTIVCPYSTCDEKVAMMPSGSVLHAVEGPYGIPVQSYPMGSILCVGDEKGFIALWPVMASLRKAGNRVVALLTAPTTSAVILEEELKALCDEMIIITKDNSQGQSITVEQAVARAIRNHSVQGVFIAGNARTVRDTWSQSINYSVATQALMVDTAPGKSVHGMFRVSICGNVRSVCVDGHDFNAYYATFDEMVRRFEQGTKEKQPVEVAI